MGSHLLGEKKYDEGEFYINKAISLHPKAVDAYIALGNSYHHRNESDKAIEQYRKAYAIEPKGIGWIYLQIIEQGIITDYWNETD